MSMKRLGLHFRKIKVVEGRGTGKHCKDFGFGKLGGQ